MIGIIEGNTGKEDVNMYMFIVIIGYITGLFMGRFLAHRDIVRKGWFKFKGKCYSIVKEEYIKIQPICDYCQDCIYKNPRRKYCKRFTLNQRVKNKYYCQYKETLGGFIYSSALNAVKGMKEGMKI